MYKTKTLAIIGLYTALLIGAQVALFSIAGVEIVTVLFTAFCFYFGRWKGMAVGTAFSILRILIFGFMPNVVLLYLIYYNLFALVIGSIGKTMDKKLNFKRLILVVIVVALLTILFTILDNLITPLMYSYGIEAFKAYCIASLTALIPQTICAIISVALIFPPLIKIFEKIKL